MTKIEMLKEYNAHTKAASYILGYVHNHKVYMLMADHIDPEMLTVERLLVIRVKTSAFASAKPIRKPFFLKASASVKIPSSSLRNTIRAKSSRR